MNVSKRRFFSALIALIMLMTLLPTVSLADGECAHLNQVSFYLPGSDSVVPLNQQVHEVTRYCWIRCTDCGTVIEQKNEVDVVPHDPTVFEQEGATYISCDECGYMAPMREEVSTVPQTPAITEDVGSVHSIVIPVSYRSVLDINTIHYQEDVSCNQGEETIIVAQAACIPAGHEFIGSTSVTITVDEDGNASHSSVIFLFQETKLPTPPPTLVSVSQPSAAPTSIVTVTPAPIEMAAPIVIPNPTTPPNQFKTERLNDGTLIITGYIGDGGEVVIPDTINGRPVTAIGKQAFEYKNIISLVIPEGVITIGDYAFSFNWNMESVTLPSTLKVIGDCAFNQCDIREVSLPEGLEEIGAWAFSFNEELTQFHIPASVTYIGGSFLCGNADIKAFTIDNENKAYKLVDGVLFSADGSILMYYLLANTREVYIVPEGVIEIADGAFWTGNKLKSIELPHSLQTIGQVAFSDCSSLKSITIPSCTELGANAFQKCKALKEIVLPEGITTIYFATFSDCSNLETVILPKSVTEIYSYVISRSSKLTKIHMSGNVTYINDDAFDGQKNIIIVCPRDSYAWEYAKSHNIQVQAAVEYESVVSTPETTSTPKPTATPKPKQTNGVSTTNSSLEIGSVVTFGHYEQDGSTANGAHQMGHSEQAKWLCAAVRREHSGRSALQQFWQLR